MTPGETRQRTATEPVTRDDVVRALAIKGYVTADMLAPALGVSAARRPPSCSSGWSPTASSPAAAACSASPMTARRWARRCWRPTASPGAPARAGRRARRLRRSRRAHEDHRHGLADEGGRRPAGAQRPRRCRLRRRGAGRAGRAARRRHGLDQRRSSTGLPRLARYAQAPGCRSRGSCRPATASTSPRPAWTATTASGSSCTRTSSDWPARRARRRSPPGAPERRPRRRAPRPARVRRSRL